MAAPPVVVPSADWPRLQNFKIMKVLGKGSYGKVYKVQRLSDEQCYALKEIDMASLDQIQRHDAVNEIRLLCSINHPNITRYHEAFTSGTKLYVVMEYAPYGELKYYIDKAVRINAPFPEECVWRLFLQLAKGLAALHSQNIIHRDIKPANIFLCANDMLKIGDLGIAKALTHLQFTRTQIGTPLYMAPEVWLQKPYSYSSDMWSLGCLLYEMMTFNPPFKARTGQELLARIQAAKYEPIPAGAYSPELIAFANSLLQLDPRARPTAEQILATPEAQKWLRVVPVPRRASESGPLRPSNDGSSLLSTILVPKDLKHLPKVLPPPSYDTDPVKPAAADKPKLNIAIPFSQAPSKIPSPVVRSSSSGIPPKVPSFGNSPTTPQPPQHRMPARRASEGGNGNAIGTPAGAAAGAGMPPRRRSDNGMPRASEGLMLPPINVPRASSDGRLQMGQPAPPLPVAVRPAGRRVTCA